MRINKVYLEASFISFLIHAVIILYLLGYFYFEAKERSILSRPIEVSLVFKEEVQQKTKVNQIQESTFQDVTETKKISQDNIADQSISFDSLIPSMSFEDLLEEENLIFQESEQNQVELYSSLIIQSLQSAWRKPINIQNGLVCDLRITINKNGRIINVNLIKSSGNIRFDNSAMKALQRIETFNFFDSIPYNIYLSNFKNIVITFNPS
jgi:colicin import membrane protein